MPLTNFQNGVSSFGMPLIGSGPILTTGNVFFVSSTSTAKADSTSNGRDPATPLATIDYAIGLCTANNGDHIICLPGHVETVTAAAGVALDVAGVTIVGIGSGTLRPTINFTTAVGASFKVTAANCVVRNLIFKGSIDALTNPVHILAADFTMESCKTMDASAVQATDFILTTAAADRLKILNHHHEGDTAAGANSWLALVGGDGAVIDGLRLDGNFDIAGIDIRTTALTDLEVRNVMFRTRIGTQAKDIFLKDTITGSTGLIGPSIYMRLSTNTANVTEAITGATFVLFDDIFVVNLAGEKAMLINTTATTDA